MDRQTDFPSMSPAEDSQAAVVRSLSVGHLRVLTSGSSGSIMGESRCRRGEEERRLSHSVSAAPCLTPPSKKERLSTLMELCGCCSSSGLPTVSWTPRGQRQQEGQTGTDDTQTYLSLQVLVLIRLTGTDRQTDG